MKLLVAPFKPLPFFSGKDDCWCQLDLRICVGVRMQSSNNHRDCSLVHHISSILFNNQLIGAHNISVPFNIRWPLKVGFIFNSTKIIIITYNQSNDPSIASIHNFLIILYFIHINCLTIPQYLIIAFLRMLMRHHR